LLPVRIYGDPVLRKTSRPVEVFDDKLRSFAEAMAETMLAEDGVGLAANQVGEDIRVVVIDITAGEQPPVVLINPNIIEKSEELIESDEGCLSLPGITLPVKRHAEVSVTAVDLAGKPFTMEHATGLLARALQHEIDHLNGIMFIDHVSALQRTMIRGKLRKLAKTGSVDS
jgi:peptide deformylase